MRKTTLSPAYFFSPANINIMKSDMKGDNQIMADTSIYRDLAERTSHTFYLGVIGPVRTGKSTFIKKFM